MMVGGPDLASVILIFSLPQLFSKAEGNMSLW